MAQKYMTLIDEPVSLEGVLTPEKGTSAMAGSGDVSYRCGACKTRLLDDMGHDDICGADIVVKCPKCGRFNELPEEDKHHHHH